MRTGPCPLLAVLALLAAAACSENRDRLLADLQSPRPEVRAAAVRKLAKVAQPDDLALFTRAAQDLSASVRAEATEALGQSQDPRVVDLLGALLEDPDEDVQSRAARALSQVKDDKAKEYLTSQYARRGRRTRQAIVQALTEAKVPKPMAAAVAAESKSLWDRNLLALTQGSLPERVAAAEELGKSGRPEAVARLLPLVRDSQVILAAAAVRGLGEAGDKQAVPAILPLLDESFPELREAAILALRKLQDPQAAARLRAVALEKSATSLLATQALAALPQQKETDEALCTVALDGAPAEALSAAQAMRSRNGCPLQPLLERLGRASSAASALQALAGLGPSAREALPKVLPFLSSSDPSLRLLAAEALTTLGDSSAAPALQKALEQELQALRPLREDWISQPLPQRYDPGFDPATPKPAPKGERAERFAPLLARLEAIQAARARGSQRPPPATELFDEVEPGGLSSLAALLRALGSVQAPGARELLEGFTRDTSMTLRAAAWVGLVHLGPEGVALARAGLLEPEREVQKAVAEALAAQGEVGQAALLERLSQSGNERAVLLEVLARTGAPASAVPLLARLVEEGGPEAVLAAQLLARLQARDALPSLLKALEDPTSLARREVLLALGQVGDQSVADTLARDLYHDLPEIRAAAATALARVGSATQAPALEALQGDYYQRVREAASAALANQGAAAGGAR